GNTTLVQQCAQFPPLPGLLATRTVKMGIGALCANTSAPECANCSMMSCGDYLRTYADICTRTPYAAGCEVYTYWCNASLAWEQSGNSSISYYCPRNSSNSQLPPSSNPLKPPSPYSPPPPPAGPPCVLNSSLPECVSYEYPAASIAADLNSLCTSMPYMPGCTVMSACQNGTATGAFCRPFTLLSSICYDMPGMSGCKSYRTLCAANSVVPQCTQFPAIPGLPTTKAARSAVSSICAAVSAPECSACSTMSCSDYLA
ncbi:hypothetical protein Agub_g7060, partial [Astrephomene gubernaculifera]